MKKTALIWTLTLLCLCFAACFSTQPGRDKTSGSTTGAGISTQEAASKAEFEEEITSQEAIPGKELVITAFPVYKADCLLIQYDGRNILIDTGEARDGSLIAREMKKLGVHKLDAMIITHYDKDHAGGAPYLIGQFDVEQIYLPDYLSSKDDYYELKGKLEDYFEIRQNQVQQEPVELNFGAVKLTIYPAKHGEAIMKEAEKEDNNLSLVTMLTYGNCRFLFAADVEELRIEDMLQEDVDWRCDWIKMPHHGRFCSQTKELLDAAQPKYAVICCSQAEYAETKTIKALKKRNIAIFDTVESAVRTTCDGVNIQIEK